MVVVSATKNEHKLAEIREIVKLFGMEIKSQNEMGLADIEIIEDGETFEENSEKKAACIMKMSNNISIADDSGLSVDALNGQPGVYSARFAGEHADDKANNEKLLKLLSKEQNRRAKFVCVITMVYPDGRKLVARGECHGKIISEPRGKSGFGYDPLFVPDGYDKTFGELGAETKNKISHRAMALQQLKKLLMEN